MGILKSLSQTVYIAWSEIDKFVHTKKFSFLTLITGLKHFPHVFHEIYIII